MNLAFKRPAKGAACHMGAIPSLLNPACCGLCAQRDALPLYTLVGSVKGLTKGYGF